MAKRRFQAAATALSLLGLGLCLASCSSSTSSLQSPSAPPTPPHLANFVPSDATVTRVRSVQMLAQGPRQEVVQYISQAPSANGFTYRNFIILSWDAYADRWVNVFDASKVQALGSEGSSQSNAILPVGENVPTLDTFPLASAPGRVDVAFAAFVNAGANGTMEVGIVHYDGQTAALAYSDNFYPPNGNVSGPAAVNAAPHQLLRITAGWHTIDDPECCAVRNYDVEVGLQPNPPSSGGGSSYLVKSSTQSWVGAFLVVPNTGSIPSTGNPVVVNVVQGSPADGLLQVGDQIVEVSGASPNPDADLGPAVIDEIANGLPGTVVPLVILRNGAQQVVNVKLASTAVPAYSTTVTPNPGFLGVQVSDSPVSGEPSGGYVEGVESSSPAATAGLSAGDVITSIGPTQIASTAALQAALNTLTSGATVNVGYVDTSGNPQSVSVTLSVYPSAETAPQVAEI